MKLIKNLLLIISMLLFSASVFGITCGDGVVEGIEECDDGGDNSDNEPDACRTDCTFARCGDGVEDSDEDCDDGEDNDDDMPGACREDCQDARCGDGVLDYMLGEICDDGDTDSGDGCHQCIDCYVPYDDMVVTGDVRLCPGV
ncbi:hypothetical protein KY345_04535, partial [Candidatus Woesearchaeota archaeon]|nr:hypothetical protein [Candidatus Woesearchaeota archaeon]